MSAEVDAYIAALPAPEAVCLTALRATLRRILPDAAEVMSYAMPGFRQRKMVAGYAWFRNQGGLYPHSGSIIPAFAAECATRGFTTSKSGVNFTVAHPLPDDLVARIVAARLHEIG